MDAPRLTVFEVTWHVETYDTVRTCRVLLVEGYSTIADIPRIIAVKRTGNPALAHAVVIDSLKEVR